MSPGDYSSLVSVTACAHLSGGGLACEFPLSCNMNWKVRQGFTVESIIGSVFGCVCLMN